MIRAVALTLVALVVSVVLFHTEPALAEPPSAKALPVYVLSVWTNDVDDQADALTQALRSRVRQIPGWSLADTNQSFETLSIALRCPPTPNQACLDRIGDQLHTDHFVWGTMSKERAGEVTAELRLWSRGKAQVEASESYSDNLKDASDDSLRAIAGRLFAKLTNSSTGGTLVVHAGTASGAVLVDGALKGRLDGGIARIEVPEGSHAVAVRISGFTAPTQTVSLDDGGEQEISFALSPLESPASAPAPAPETESAPPDQVHKKGAPVRKIIGWVVVAAGVGFLVAAGVEGAHWISDKNTSDTDCSNIPNTVTDVCNPVGTLTQDQMNSASDACAKSTNANSVMKLGWIFAGVGAVLAGTGIWLVVGDHSGDPSSDATARNTKPKLDVLPSFGPRAGSLNLRLTF